MKTTHYDSANEFDPVSYFEGKKVLLVGNSENPKEQDYLKYNSIVRMNLGVQEEPCDVWINNLVYQGHKSLGYIPDVDKIMRMNCEKQGRRLNRLPIDFKYKKIKIIFKVLKGQLFEFKSLSHFGFFYSTFLMFWW